MTDKINICIHKMLQIAGRDGNSAEIRIYFRQKDYNTLGELQEAGK